MFESSEPKEKQQIIKYFVQNYQVDGKTPYFTITKPFNWILKIADELTWLGLLDEFRTCKWATITSEYTIFKSNFLNQNLFIQFPRVDKVVKL